MPRAKSSKRRRVGRPPGRNSRDTEHDVLDAAERVFAKVGFEGARIKEIADEAGVTKAMVHYYFEGKQKLCQAVLDSVLFELIKLLQEVTSRGGDPIEQLDDFIRGFFDYIARHPHFARLGFAGGGAEKRYFDTIIAQFFHPLLARGVEFVEAGISAGAFRATNVEQLWIAMYSVVTSYFSDARFISLVLKRDAMSEASITMARDAVRQIFFRTLGVEPPDRQGPAKPSPKTA